MPGIKINSVKSLKVKIVILDGLHVLVGSRYVSQAEKEINFCKAE